MLTNISLPDAGVLAAVGYGVVFAGLIVLMVVIILVGKAFSAKQKAKVAPVVEEASVQMEETSSASLAPIVEPTREKLGDLAKCDEDVLSYIAFPNLAEKFLEERKAKEENVVTYSIVEA